MIGVRRWSCVQRGVHAQDGSDGLLKVQEREYDVIISDIDMPRMNGIEFLKRIHPYVESTTPFMILTAYGEWEYAMEAIRLGACNFLQKPFAPSTLVETVNRMFSGGHPAEAVETGS